MANVEAVRAEVLKKLTHAVDLGDGVLRSDRQYEDKNFATTYIDLSDDIVERSRNLASFQEELLGETFFEGEGNQRWNSYLYFWAGPRSAEHEEFQEAKSRIESDRHYARKFVLSEEDLLSRIEDVARSRPQTAVSGDVLSQWSEQLREASLDIVLEQKPRAQLLRLIENGEAFRPAATTVSKAPSKTADPLGTGILRALHVASFRAAFCNGPFSFGDVNLVVGQNGSGKTSLLELIEALYCGRIRRDSAATFSGIQAKLLMPNSTTVDIEGTTASAAIKARNLAWYGRSDHHANTISEGFTRFNFLDTDAAFRLSDASSLESIKKELSSLLVGPETSALWAYLSKLREDVAANLRSQVERLSSLTREAELLGPEIKRLQDAPSQATSLAKTYRASLKALGAMWDVGDAASLVGRSDRARLEALSRGFRHALATPSVSPLTKEALRARTAALGSATKQLGVLCKKYEALGSDFASSQSELASCHETLRLLQQWKKYCEAGVPDLVGSIARTAQQIDALRLSLAGLTISSIPEFPPEYKDRTIEEAKEAAGASLLLAQAQERSGVEGLGQLEQLGLSLQALKGDLRSIAGAIIERTGDSTHCPVCGTFHERDDLLQKIEALESPGDPAVNEGLRLAIQESRARADRERRVIAGINALEKYATSSGASSSITIAQLREALASEQNSLDALLVEQHQQMSAEESLDQLGLNLASYHDIRNAAASILDQEKDLFDAHEVNRTLKAWEDKLQAAQRASTTLHEALAENAKCALSLATEVGGVQGTSAPVDLLFALQRMREHVEASAKFIEDASEQIDVPEARPLTEIQSAIEEAIESFDRARHAEASESSARTDLGRKTGDLQRVTAQIQEAASKREHLAKAEEVLRRIELNYSLEKAAGDSLGSIREQVSYIFKRIHAPSEYELGDFEGDSILVTRDGKLSRGANQISTGQRAALALSIFLALNQSAERAPPIMLIDDPIAHIDDLNALSFFDYLRDLAVSDRKQIFFATADTRVAALFQKKFEFLGHRYRRIVLSR